MSDAASDLTLMQHAARVAGAEVMRWFRTDLEVHHKAPGQPLTEADLAANRILHEMLMGGRGGYGWLSEETVDSPDRLGRERVWVVDPIDGTRSFISGRREFAISVGLVAGGEPVAGVVYNPATAEMYSALAGGGAWLATVEVADSSFAGATIADGEVLRIAAGPDRGSLLASRSEIAAGEFEPFADEFEIRPAGSTAYKLACVARGVGSAFVSRGPKSEWDICAGVLIVQEAGGVATDVNGRRPEFNCPDPYVHGTVAAAPSLHGRLVERIRSLPPAPRFGNREGDPLHPGLEEGGT